MSDPLSVSTSIAGFIGLATQVTSVLKNYIDRAKSAHEDAKRLNELLALCLVLDQMRDLLCGEEAQLKRSSFGDTSLLISVLGSTNYHVDKLYKKLSKFSTPNSNKLGDICDRLTWPLGSDDYEKSVADLHHLAQVFHAAWLSDTHSNVMTKLQENHNELQTTITTLQKMAISPPKEVLDQLTQVLGLLATIGNVSESITEIKNISLGLQRLERKCEEGELYTLMKWMTPTEPQVRHKEMAQSRLKNTGDWFTEMVDFQNWKGAGKSIICSLVIDYLSAKSQGNSCVIWLYCDYRDGNKQTAIYMIAALLKQVILATPETFDTIIRALQEIKGSPNKDLELNKLCEFLTEALQQFSNVYICIVALDEFQKDRASFLTSLEGILNYPALKNSLKLFLTGRPPMESVVEDNFVGSKLHAMTLTANTSDIVKYIDNQIKLSDRDGVVMGEDFLQSLKKTIIDTANGMFLLPALQIQHILEKTTLRDRRDALNAMPKGLNDAFQDTLRRIQSQPGQKGKQALNALTWVFLAETIDY
ncbi:Similar to ankyrin [Exophiala dermatitidis NIH/UT8656]; acc. no. EHY59712 [Pyronema omphalodes CBS 100304]|uniref:Similar to ankyrin [Exophiala dermatitidis NIH/UT8656] acc. no. EHY59712 n=1 Tax=Pyronema omphalodes (strain CBS 100304) TaxID=1076935 RepID=U4LVJ9_PYROM|nr:Similar to ankyrin [Exophiala dermatitidis NIH/UT8656]; acc. no. EHY59712 [Pyronema omphalodes CBS 100304]